MSFSLISCESGVTTSEFDPLLDDSSAESGENEPLEGFWRIEGIIDAPLDWSPGYPYLVQIWMSAYGGGMDQLIVPMTFTLLFTYPGQDYRRWSFETRGDGYWWGDIYHRFFIPNPTWWSDPEEEVYQSTWVQGYKWVEFGGGGTLVLADEDTSFNPYNPPYHGPEWKYYQPYLDDLQPGCELFWAWTSVYLDLTD